MKSFLLLNSRKIFKILGIVFAISLFFLYFYFKKEKNNLNGKIFYRPRTAVLSSSVVSKFINIFGQVGENHLTLEGYTSPFSTVELSTGLFTVTEKTTASQDGYFIFQNILLHPFLSKEPCLISIDKNNFISPPLCLSSLPKNKEVYITGVILAPSLNLEKSQVSSGITAKASGFATPNSNISLYLFREEKKRFWANLIKSAGARGAPIFNFKSQKNGYFEFSLPSYLPTNYRLFVIDQFCPPKKSPFCGNSPKSHTLNFRVLSFWERVILTIYNFIYLLKLFLGKIFGKIASLLFSELGVIFLLIFFLRKKKRKKHRLKNPGFLIKGYGN